LPQDALAAPDQVLPHALLHPSQDQVLEGVAAQAVSLADRPPLGPVAAADVVVGSPFAAVGAVVSIPMGESLEFETTVLADQKARQQEGGVLAPAPAEVVAIGLLLGSTPVRPPEEVSGDQRL